MKLTPKEQHDLRLFATRLMTCANEGVLPDAMADALTAIGEAVPAQSVTNEADESFLPPVPYFKKSTK